MPERGGIAMGGGLRMAIAEEWFRGDIKKAGRKLSL